VYELNTQKGIGGQETDSIQIGCQKTNDVDTILNAFPTFLAILSL